MLADDEIIHIIPKTQLFLNYFMFIFCIISIVQMLGLLFNKLY
jgi:hypothetical protein